MVEHLALSHKISGSNPVVCFSVREIGIAGIPITWIFYLQKIFILSDQKKAFIPIFQNGSPKSNRTSNQHNCFMESNPRCRISRLLVLVFQYTRCFILFPNYLNSLTSWSRGAYQYQMFPIIWKELLALTICPVFFFSSCNILSSYLHLNGTLTRH